MIKLNIAIFKNSAVKILALGAESAGFFAVCFNGNIFISDNFGDLLDEINFLKYKKAVLTYLKKEKFRPDIILTDLHPFYKTTILGEELAKKYKAPHIKVQHHIAHIFSAVGDKILTFCHSERSASGVKNPARMCDLSHSREIPLRQLADRNDKLCIPNTFLGIAMDGTGYGLDENIWGGEVLKFNVQRGKLKAMERIGSLEEQIMIGGDLAVREPARILISILSKFLPKEKTYQHVKKYYTRNEFEALHNQMEQNFNCRKTTSTGRILDAASVLLGFAGNERKFKHEAVKKLEENSTKSYTDLKPQISFSVIASDQQERSNLLRMQDLNLKQVERLPRRPDDYNGTPRNDKRMILQTTPLFEYLLKNIHKDSKRLAATTQAYIARGLYEIIKKNHESFIINRKSCIFAAGGMANNKIISEYLEKQGVYLAKKNPRGDEGIAVGQIVYYLLNSI